MVWMTLENSMLTSLTAFHIDCWHGADCGAGIGGASLFLEGWMVAEAVVAWKKWSPSQMGRLVAEQDRG
jgi:hypothetical protein